MVDFEKIQDHLVICGWNSKGEIVVREYLAAHRDDDMPIVVITEINEDEVPEFADPSIQARVHFLRDDFTKVSALEKAGIYRAHTCIILSAVGNGRSEQDADARTILTALTVEKLKPEIYTCAEIIHSDYGSHLEMGNVNDYVVSSEHSGFLLAHAGLNRGLIMIFNELLTHEHGNQFYRVNIPSAWSGRTYLELFTKLKESHNAILVAVYDDEGNTQVNPPEYAFKGGEDVMVIANHGVKL